MTNYRVRHEKAFDKKFDKLENSMKKKVLTQIKKIIGNPEIGKPMKYEKKGTRELYLKPFRISYMYRENELIILFLDIYHKDQQS
jgi:mRNA-degrading endonuclease RelE of RelBE toxin-antitoxin system